MIITKKQFKDAPLGTAFMTCCPICEQPDGNIAIKSKGKNGSNYQHFGTNDLLPNETCRWCAVRLEITQQFGKDIIGVASAQIGDKIVAFISIDNDGDSVPTASGDIIHLKHRDILDVEEDGKGFKIIGRRGDEHHKV